MSIFKAAAIQMRSGRDPDRNVVDFEALVREAAGAGAVYVQSPEMTGAVIRDKQDRARAFRAEKDDVVFAAARRLAAELGIFLHVGSTGILRDDGKIANRALLFGPDGALVARYDKVHMFDVDLDNGESWRESATYEAGREALVARRPARAPSMCSRPR
jgi:predicted amidohydrolase